MRSLRALSAVSRSFSLPRSTIDPNVARIPVPDIRFKELCKMYEPKSEVPAALTVTDIAGLVRGASEGQGLGNAFLSHIKAVDGIYHVCRGFEDKEVTHVEDSVDPVRDLTTIHNELRLKDIEACKTFINAKSNMYNKKALKKEDVFEYETVVKTLKALEEGKDVRACDWDLKEIEVLNLQLFLTAKPMIYLVNLSEKSYLAKGSSWLPKITEFVESRGCGDLILPFSVAYEQKVFDAGQSGGQPAKKAFCDKNGAPSMIPVIIKQGYKALGLINYFTAGKDEVRAWTIKRGTLCPKAAGVIHTDFEKGFISADCMNYDDLLELKNEAAVKAAGKMQMKGKTYEVQDGDILHFKFN